MEKQMEYHCSCQPDNEQWELVWFRANGNHLTPLPDKELSVSIPLVQSAVVCIPGLKGCYMQAKLKLWCYSPTVCCPWTRQECFWTSIALLCTMCIACLHWKLEPGTKLGVAQVLSDDIVEYQVGADLWSSDYKPSHTLAIVLLLYKLPWINHKWSNVGALDPTHMKLSAADVHTVDTINYVINGIGKPTILSS